MWFFSFFYLEGTWGDSSYLTFNVATRHHFPGALLGAEAPGADGREAPVSSLAKISQLTTRLKDGTVICTF